MRHVVQANGIEDKERAAKSKQIIKTAQANPQFEKFSLGIRKLIEEMMIQRMGDNDKIVTRYMDDPEFQNSAFPILAKEIFDAIEKGEFGKQTGSRLKHSASLS